MAAAIAGAALADRVKELIHGYFQKGDELIKGVEAGMLAPVLYVQERGVRSTSCARYSCVQPFASLLRLISLPKA